MLRLDNEIAISFFINSHLVAFIVGGHVYAGYTLNLVNRTAPSTVTLYFITMETVYVQNGDLSAVHGGLISSNTRTFSVSLLPSRVGQKSYEF